MAGRRAQSLTPGLPVLRECPPCWQAALTRDTDGPKVSGGSFLVKRVAEHTGEPGVGLAQWQAQIQGPRVGGWSRDPSLLQLLGEAFALPGHLQVLHGPLGPALQGDVAPAWCDG